MTDSETEAEAIAAAVEPILAAGAPADLPARVTQAFDAALPKFIGARLANSPLSRSTDAWNHAQQHLPELLGFILAELA